MAVGEPAVHLPGCNHHGKSIQVPLRRMALESHPRCAELVDLGAASTRGDGGAVLAGGGRRRRCWEKRRTSKCSGMWWVSVSWKVESLILMMMMMMMMMGTSWMGTILDGTFFLWVGKFGNGFVLENEVGEIRGDVGQGVSFLKRNGGFKLFYVNVRKVGGFSEKRNFVEGVT